MDFDAVLERLGELIKEKLDCKIRKKSKTFWSDLGVKRSTP